MMSRNTAPYFSIQSANDEGETERAGQRTCPARLSVLPPKGGSLLGLFPCQAQLALQQQLTKDVKALLLLRSSLLDGAALTDGALLYLAQTAEEKSAAFAAISHVVFTSDDWKDPPAGDERRLTGP